VWESFLSLHGCWNSAVIFVLYRNQFTHARTQRYMWTDKGILVKNFLWVQWNLNVNVSAFLRGQGLSLKEWMVSAQIFLSVFGYNPANFTNFRVCELWEATHSKGDAGHSPLWSRRTQSSSVGTTVYRVARWLTSVISKFPSRPQSIWGNSDILAATIKFRYFPDCTVLTFTRQVWYGQQDFKVWSGHAW